MTTAHSTEVQAGDRFEFGKNWKNFLDHLNDDRIATAEASMRKLLGTSSLAGKRFLDIGSGSGLFSLVARRLGATVSSFDYDPNSVGCTRSLRQRYFANDAAWTVEEGSVLDGDYMAKWRDFDVVYSWGVLHHTGSMWKAIENAMAAVALSGTFVISLYNDQGIWSRRWTKLKRIYNALPSFLRLPYAVLVMGTREVPVLFHLLRKGRPLDYLRLYTRYGAERGMSRWHDMVDWIGGYPFEVSKPEQVFHFFKERGFEMVTFTSCAGGVGCNEFVFRRIATVPGLG